MRNESLGAQPGRYPNYEVLADGSILNRRTLSTIRPIQNKTGYCKVILYVEGKAHAEYVHQLVAGKFVPKPAGATRVRHINGAKLDNRAENLEWIAPHRKLSELPLIATADSMSYMRGRTLHFANATAAVKFLQGSAKVPAVPERAVIYAARHNTRLGIFTWQFDKESDK